MKRLVYICILFTLFAGIIGCGDNSDFSNPHVLTADEVAELHRQDSLDSVRRAQINADLILEYTVESYAASTWGGADKSLEIDLEKIGELFGLTADEVKAGINGEEDAPAIKGFAIQGTTHADVDKATTTNGAWGHWWTTDGDLCDSYSQSNSALFCEWQEDYFTIGQFPEHLAAGMEIAILECLKYQDLRVAIKITYKVIERGQVTATVVSTQDLSVKMYPRTTYDSDAVPFDRAKVLSDLGISSLDDAQIIATNADGSYAQEMTANNGYWYDLDGFAGAHGENAGTYVEYYGIGDDAEEGDLDVLYVGQMPGALEGGYNKTLKYGFMANDKIVMINITVDIIAYEDPETPPAGEPVTDAVLDITIEKSWDDTFSNVQFDVKDALREAFKMTTYQIHKAKLSGDLKIYCGELSENEPEYTSDVPGYWLNAAGEVCSYGAESVVFCCLGSSETALYMYAGNHPTSCVPNTTVTSKYLISCNGGLVTVNLTVKIGAAE